MLFRGGNRGVPLQVGSGSQVIGRGAVSLFHSYYLWEFQSFSLFLFFCCIIAL